MVSFGRHAGGMEVPKVSSSFYCALAGYKSAEPVLGEIWEFDEMGTCDGFWDYGYSDPVIGMVVNARERVRKSSSSPSGSNIVFTEDDNGSYRWFLIEAAAMDKDVLDGYCGALKTMMAETCDEVVGIPMSFMYSPAEIISMARRMHERLGSL